MSTVAGSGSAVADRCRLCAEPGPRVFFEREQYPIWGGPVVPPDRAGRIGFAALRIAICRRCGFMSLTEPRGEHLSDLLYGDFYSSSNPICENPENITDWRALQLLDFIDAATGAGRGRALEVGCYDGQLLYQLRKRGWRVSGCEPNPIGQQAAARHALDVKQAYFTTGLYDPQSFELIVSRFVLEHVPEPLQFLRDVREALAPGGTVFLEVPDAGERLTNRVLGSFVPEHVSYFGQGSLCTALDLTGFVDPQFSVYPGGIIVSARMGRPSAGTAPADVDVSELRASAGSFEADMSERIDRFRQIVTQLAEAGKRIAVYGANSQTIECLNRGGLMEAQVAYVVDDDPFKEGMQLVATRLPVYSFRQLVESPVDAVIVSAYLSQEKMADAVRARVGSRPALVKFYPAPVLLP